MPACLSRSLGLPTQLPTGALKMQDDHRPGLADHSQGIISILPSSSATATTTKISALRRTLSADMSSKKWMGQSGIRKIPSVEHLHELDDDNDNVRAGEEEEPGSGSGTLSLAFEEIWSSIQRDQRKKEESDLPRQTDVWSSILSSQKASDGDKGSLPPPYVHPLVKRSASSLSEKSLEICTESLGSETGSDCFSSYPTSELCDFEQEEKEEDDQNQPQQQEEELRFPAARYATKKAAPRAFPPPLPSLAHRGEGSNLHMRSHRQNGRLVLEAVSVPSHNCFRAQRQDGRLLLTFSDNHPSSGPGDEEIDENGSTEEEEEEEDQESDWEEEDEEVEEEEEEKVERENEATDDVDAIGMVSYVHKFLNLTRSNTPPWQRRLNKVVATLEGGGCGDDPVIQAAASDAASGGCLNPYFCSWRSNPAATAEVVQPVGPNKLLELDHHQQGKSVVVVADQGKRAAKVEYLVPLLRGCNQQQPRGRSLLIWEPQCIATS